MARSDQPGNKSLVQMHQHNCECSFISMRLTKDDSLLDYSMHINGIAIGVFSFLHQETDFASSTE